MALLLVIWFGGIALLRTTIEDIYECGVSRLMFNVNSHLGIWKLSKLHCRLYHAYTLFISRKRLNLELWCKECLGKVRREKPVSFTALIFHGMGKVISPRAKEVMPRPCHYHFPKAKCPLCWARDMLYAARRERRT